MTAPAVYAAGPIAAALSWPAAVEALRAALAAGLDPELEPPRSSVQFGHGELLTMPSSGGGLAGVKLVTIAADNPTRGLPRIHGVYVLFDATTLVPFAQLDGAALTSLRTPAVSALAVDLVAPATAQRLVVFGCGPQGYRHVQALCALRPIETVRVVGRTPARAQRFVETLRREGIAASAADPGAVADADVIACCTTARTPLFDGRALSDSAVVVAVGSHEPAAREVDSETVRRCGALVESRTVALREAGDIRSALADGALGERDLVTLADVVTGACSRRPRFVKTVGMGWEDLVVAGAVARALAGSEPMTAATTGR